MPRLTDLEYTIGYLLTLLKANLHWHIDNTHFNCHDDNRQWQYQREAQLMALTCEGSNR